MEIYIDVNTGTWGDPSGIRIVEIDEDTQYALENDELTDGDIQNLGSIYGAAI